MNKLVIATLMFSTTSLAFADTQLINGDGSTLSTLCIAATQSPAAVRKAATQAGVRREDLGMVRCNGMTLAAFGKQYTEAATTPLSSTPRYSFTANDASTLTALCSAALVSDEEYRKVKSQSFRNDPWLETEVRCNGMPVRLFIQKFRSTETNVLSQR